jgi:hypothetical protein
MNPFKVLNIDRHASNKEIIKAAALGMRDKKHSAKQIAQAQKMLFDPVSRGCQEFLHLIDLTDAKERLLQKIIREAGAVDKPVTSACPQLERLTIFEKNHGN